MYTTGRCQHNQACGNFYRTVYGQNIYGQNTKNSLALQLAKHMVFRVPSSSAAATRLWNWSKEMKWLILIWTEIFANCALSLPLSRCPSKNYIHSPYRLLVWFNAAKVSSLHPTACLSGLTPPRSVHLRGSCLIHPTPGHKNIYIISLFMV